MVTRLGQWLFVTERYGVAAELFEGASSRPLAGGDLAKDKVLDWWASALERHAQTSTGERDRIFARMYDRMDAEVQRDPGSVAANYWLVASARALGELDRAWNASMAGWVRAPMAGSRADALRTDIDRLVLTGIIPDRARAAAAEGHNQRQAADTMVTEWERFKQEWVTRPTSTAQRDQSAPPSRAPGSSAPLTPPESPPRRPTPTTSASPRGSSRPRPDSTQARRAAAARHRAPSRA